MKKYFAPAMLAIMVLLHATLMVIGFMQGDLITMWLNLVGTVVIAALCISCWRSVMQKPEKQTLLG